MPTTSGPRKQRTCASASASASASDESMCITYVETRQRSERVSFASTSHLLERVNHLIKTRQTRRSKHTAPVCVCGALTHNRSARRYMSADKTIDIDSLPSLFPNNVIPLDSFPPSTPSISAALSSSSSHLSLAWGEIETFSVPILSMSLSYVVDSSPLPPIALPPNATQHTRAVSPSSTACAKLTVTTRGGSTSSPLTCDTVPEAAGLGTSGIAAIGTFRGFVRALWRLLFTHMCGPDLPLRATDSQRPLFAHVCAPSALCSHLRVCPFCSHRRVGVSHRLVGVSHRRVGVSHRRVGVSHRRVGVWAPITLTHFRSQ